MYKCPPASADTRLETLVFLRTCFRAGAYSVDGHSCCHNHLFLNKSFQNSLLYAKCFGIDAQLGGIACAVITSLHFVLGLPYLYPNIVQMPFDDIFVVMVFLPSVHILMYYVLKNVLTELCSSSPFRDCSCSVDADRNGVSRSRKGRTCQVRASRQTPLDVYKRQT